MNRCARESPDNRWCILDAGHAGDCQSAEVALAEALGAVLESARPNQANHPTMWSAWEKARELLARVKGSQ